MLPYTNKKRHYSKTKPIRLISEEEYEEEFDDEYYDDEELYMSGDIMQETILVNSFTEESSRKFREQVLRKASIDPNMPIIVYIDSYGGYVDSLNSMLATMRQVPNQFVTVCVGKAMSCGAVLLSAGDFRFIDEGSRAMIHQSSSGAVGPTEGQQNSVNENKRLNKQLMDFILGRCGKSMTQFKEAIKKSLHPDDDGRDLYLDAKEAVAFGLVDFIGMPLIKPVVMFQIETAPKKKYESVQSYTLELEELDKKKLKKAFKKAKKKATKKTVKKTVKNK